MNRRLAIIGSIIICVMMGGFAGWLITHTSQLALLQAHGPVAAQQRGLMGLALGLMLLVIVPVYVLTFTIALRYRAGNPKASYQPEWDSHRGLEALWWGIPMAIIAALASITWQSSHQLDPARPLAAAAAAPPLTVQVVALQWKWLFIYPDEGVASVNLLEIPAGRPVTFQITSDAPMNSFWIPELGGQIYAMSGMTTRLNLQADEPGTYRGVSANLSGAGFADMNFRVKAVTPAQFADWRGQIRQTGSQLDAAAYNQLAEPGLHPAAGAYGGVASGLYDDVVTKYMVRGAAMGSAEQAGEETP